jgi:uncharacterized protein DUF1206
MTASASSVVRGAESWVEALARLGFFVKGIVYATIGVLAVSLALGFGGETTDPQGALRALGESPIGHVSLAIIALGLLAYATWRLIAAMTRGDDEPDGHWGRMIRLGKTIDGVVHALLGLEALRLFRALLTPQQDVAQTWSARALRIPGGRWIVISVGAGLVIFAVYQLYRTLTHGSRDHLHTRAMTGAELTAIDLLGRYGTSSLSIVLVLIGTFLVRTAITYDPRRAGGIGYSLGVLAREPHGRWLLTIVSFGFISFGAFQMVSARYRRVRVRPREA